VVVVVEVGDRGIAGGGGAGGGVRRADGWDTIIREAAAPTPTLSLQIAAGESHARLKFRCHSYYDYTHPYCFSGT